MLDKVLDYVPSIQWKNYVALARQTPREVVGFVMLGAAGAGAFLWNNSFARINGIDKTRGKLK